MNHPTESDGFQTVTPLNTGKRFDPRHEDAAFKAFLKTEGTSFYLMLAYKHGDRTNLRTARDRLAEAVAIIDAALSDDDAKVAALQAARAERRAGE